MITHRQEVLNVILAELLNEREITSSPETILNSANLSHLKSRRMPDVLLNYNGLRVVIESEYGNSNIAKDKAYRSASKRINEGIAHIGIALIYPPNLKNTPFNELKENLKNIYNFSSQKRWTFTGKLKTEDYEFFVPEIDKQKKSQFLKI